MNKELIVVPYKSVGDLSFGMKRDEVRKIMGEYIIIPKEIFSNNSSDSFYNGKIDCYYNKDDLFYGAIISNEINVILNGKQILPISEKDFNNMFDDALLNYAEESMTFVKSVGLTSYNYDKEVSSLTVGTKEFYEE